MIPSEVFTELGRQVECCLTAIHRTSKSRFGPGVHRTMFQALVLIEFCPPAVRCWTLVALVAVDKLRLLWRRFHLRIFEVDSRARILHGLACLGCRTERDGQEEGIRNERTRGSGK